MPLWDCLTVCGDSFRAVPGGSLQKNPVFFKLCLSIDLLPEQFLVGLALSPKVSAINPQTISRESTFERLPLLRYAVCVKCDRRHERT